jgi:formamidopyrimidine-DNA glycosylase
MPEMPEVEAVCRKLRCLEGAAIAGVRVMRCAPPALAKRVAGRRIETVDRRGKHILVRLEGGLTLHVHLRMSGNFYPIPDCRFYPAGARVTVELDDGRGLVLDDRRALAKMETERTPVLDARLAREMGPEPLSDQFTVNHLMTSAKRTRQPAKLFLMDQRRVAGLGNIYAAEVLFTARIDPRKPMHRLSGARIETLHAAIVTLLRDAVQSACRAYAGPGEMTARQGGTDRRDVDPLGAVPGRLAEAEIFPLAVYGREGEPCLRCGRVIRRIPQGGRSTYYCPGCQR